MRAVIVAASAALQRRRAGRERYDFAAAARGNRAATAAPKLGDFHDAGGTVAFSFAIAGTPTGRLLARQARTICQTLGCASTAFGASGGCALTCRPLRQRQRSRAGRHRLTSVLVSTASSNRSGSLAARTSCPASRLASPC